MTMPQERDNAIESARRFLIAIAYGEDKDIWLPMGYKTPKGLVEMASRILRHYPSPVEVKLMRMDPGDSTRGR